MLNTDELIKYIIKHMTTQQIDLVKDSWPLVLLYRKEAGKLLYNELFTLAPETRKLFHGDIEKQEQKMLSTITLMVAKLKKLEDLTNEVHYLAKRHVEYEAKPEHFKILEKALMHMLAEVLKTKWDLETQKAWKAAYDVIANAMITGMTKGK